jgi:hypothetical protein
VHESTYTRNLLHKCQLKLAAQSTPDSEEVRKIVNASSYYQILEVDDNCAPDEIKRAYR